MHLPQSGVPFNVVALWFGHRSTNTTHRYVEANLGMTEKGLARMEAPDIKLKRFRASDDLMKSKRLQLCEAPRLRARPPTQLTPVQGAADLRTVESYACGRRYQSKTFGCSRSAAKLSRASERWVRTTAVANSDLPDRFGEGRVPR